ncbi:MAG TPA: hypothetical protein VFG18_03795, partial [Xanthomonadaceae bacterium]|nr:hypothetical protein [Xanthomonadaceae bacterium]
QERRATRLRPDGLAWDWPAPGVLRLAFVLPAGAYATALLAELGTASDRSSESQFTHNPLPYAGV